MIALTLPRKKIFGPIKSPYTGRDLSFFEWIFFGWLVDDNPYYSRADQLLKKQGK